MLYTYRQEEHETNAKHVQNLTSIIDAIDHVGGSIFDDKGLIEHETKKDQDQLSSVRRSEEQIKKDVKEKMMGLMVIKRANKLKYGKLLTTIRDQHSFGIDVYPKTMHEAYELMENHSSTKEKPRYEHRYQGEYAGGRGAWGHGAGGRGTGGRGAGRGGNGGRGGDPLLTGCGG